MKMRIAFVLALALALWGAVPSWAGQDDWLLGKWEMAYDPDGSPTDWIEFKPEGRVVVTAEKGGPVAGEYVVHGADLQMTFHKNGRDIPIAMKYDAKKKRLLNFSQRTGHSAEYKKLQ
jgi:uncharacterized protein (TIGR03066 family)